MATDAELKKSIFLLTPEQDRKVNAITESLSRELGVKLSRSAAIRLIVDRFIVTQRPVDRSMTAEMNAA